VPASKNCAEMVTEASFDRPREEEEEEQEEEEEEEELFV